jgi:hypothetical protein
VGHNRDVPELAASAVAILALLLARGFHRRRMPGQTLIVTPRKSTVISADGAVRSVQSALLTLSREDLRRMWTPASLENLGRTYWRFLSRATLGLIRVRYRENERAVVFLSRPLTLLRFDAPTYDFGPQRGRITWQIRDGLLVATTGRGSGWLSVDVQCEDPHTDPARLLIEVEVANFYPAIASGIGKFFYEATQAFVHVLVTHAFLRSLATLDLAESKVGRFKDEERPAGATGRTARR